MPEERRVEHFVLLNDGTYVEVKDALIVSVDRNIVESDEQLNNTMDAVDAWMKVNRDSPTPVTERTTPADGVMCIAEVGVAIVPRPTTEHKLH